MHLLNQVLYWILSSVDCTLSSQCIHLVYYVYFTPKRPTWEWRLYRLNAVCEWSRGLGITIPEPKYIVVKYMSWDSVVRICSQNMSRQFQLFSVFWYPSVTKMASVDIDAILAKLSLKEKVHLLPVMMPFSIALTRELDLITRWRWCMADGANPWERNPLCQGTESLLESPSSPVWLSTQTTDGPNGARGSKIKDGKSAACFPAACSVASTFDVDIARRIGVALGAETDRKSVV